jgi:muconolactone delta-isomerase
MEFLVGFDVTVPDGTPGSEVEESLSAEATPAAGLARDRLLAALPLDGWMQFTVTPLEPQPNDPASPGPSVFRLPNPRLMPVYRLDATLGETVDLGDTGHGHRRVVPLTGGTFTGPTITGKLLVYESYLVQ